MARTKTNTRNDTKTLTTSRRNIHLDKLYFCVFRIFLFQKWDPSLLEEVSAGPQDMNWCLWHTFCDPGQPHPLTDLLGSSFVESREWAEQIPSLHPMNSAQPLALPSLAIAPPTTVMGMVTNTAMYSRMHAQTGFGDVLTSGTFHNCNIRIDIHK